MCIKSFKLVIYNIYLYIIYIDILNFLQKV